MRDYRGSFPFRRVVPVLLAVLAAISRPSAVNLCTDPGPLPKGESWISLPDQTCLRSAEDLCVAIPNAVWVRQGNPNTPASPQWTFNCSSKTCVPTGTSDPKEPTCSVSSCFCVDPPEGFAVSVSAATTVSFAGCETQFPVTLSSGASRIVSVPNNPTLVKASDLATVMGLTSTGLNSSRGVVSRLVCSTGVVQSYIAGTNTAFAFTLVPGEGYRIADPSPISYTNPAVASSCSATGSASYCIDGTGNGTSYAWWIDVNKDANVSNDPLESTAPGAPVNATKRELAEYFIASINANANSPSSLTCAALKFPNVPTASCFKVSSINPFDLYVDTAGAVFPAGINKCPVVFTLSTAGGGCVYNPTIFLEGEEPIPTVSTWGIAAVVLLLLTAGVILVRRSPWL